jgi:cytochrome b involved in lipid metabolism
MAEKKLTTTIDGCTYDITSFVQNHPGGADMLMLAHDIDSSILFHSYHRCVEFRQVDCIRLTF